MSGTSSTALRVDTHLIKFGQAWVIGLTALAFVLVQPWIALITGLALAVSALAPAVGPFRLMYARGAVPLGLIRPRIVEDDPAPHRFAQGVGAVFLLTASALLLLSRATALGWALDLIVFVLAGIDLTAGFCAGCFVYFHLGRLGWVPRVRYSGGFRWRGA